jgi:hypothetical protein
MTAAAITALKPVVTPSTSTKSDKQQYGNVGQSGTRSRTYARSRATSFFDFFSQVLEFMSLFPILIFTR